MAININAAAVTHRGSWEEAKLYMKFIESSFSANTKPNLYAIGNATQGNNEKVGISVQKKDIMR